MGPSVIGSDANKQVGTGHCSFISISDELESIHFQDSDSGWNSEEGEQIRGRWNCELGVGVERNKLTRPLGFGEKAFHEP